MRVVKRNQNRNRMMPTQKTKITNKKLSFKDIVINTILVVGFIAFSVFLLFAKHKYVENNDNLLTRFLTIPEEPVSPLEMEVIALTEGLQVTEAEIEVIRQNYITASKELEIYKEKAKSPNQSITLDYTKLTEVPQYIADMIIREWVRHGGTDALVPLSICEYESKFNPLTRNTNGENSWGLFQVNVGHPAHAARMGHRDYARLYEPLFNVQYQFPELVAYEKKAIAQGLKGSEVAKYVSRYGQRPLWKQWIADAIDRNYSRYNNAIIK